MKNPFLEIKKLIDNLALYNSIWVETTNDELFEITKENETFNIENTTPGSSDDPKYIYIQELSKENLMSWITTNLKNILSVELVQTDGTNVVYYTLDTDKRRLDAARTIQKYAIPRYNDPERPEVIARELARFNELSFGKQNKIKKILNEIKYLRNL